MAVAVALDRIDPAQVKRNEPGPNKPASRVYPFFWAKDGARKLPTAFLVRYDKNTWSSAHFHSVDQFNVVVEGRGLFGRHELRPYNVHFSRAYTPYGPLEPNKEEGWAFLTLRARHDPGAQRMPESIEKLKQVPNRDPWQVTRQVSFPRDESTPAIELMPELRDERGLAVYAFTVPAGQRVTAPAAGGTDGQYIVVLEGSIQHDGTEHRGLAVISVEPNEPAFELHAGANGARGLVLNFPRLAQSPSVHAAPAAAAEPELGRWQCVLCAFVYDEKAGMPEDGIAPGTRWEDVPESWTCPDCSAGKSDFEMVRL